MISATPPKRVHLSGTRSVPARASVANSTWFSAIPLASEMPRVSTAILLHNVGPLPFNATRSDATQKQGLAAQQVHASFRNRGCADPCGRQFPRHTSCTQMAGRRPQGTIRACGQAMQESSPAHTNLHRVGSRLSVSPQPLIVPCVPFFHGITVNFNHAQFRRKECAPTLVGHDILQTFFMSKDAFDLVVGPQRLCGIHPESRPSSGHGHERRQTNNSEVSLCLSTSLCVSDCSGWWHTRH